MNEAPMSSEELAAILQREYTAADSYRDVLAQLELQAFQYYEGQPFGNEVEGRSQIVLPDVQETIDYMTASVLRTFVSGDRTVEFEATDEGEEAGAEEATAAVNYSFMRQQDGYRILHDGCVDGLLRKIGVFKTCYETVETVTKSRVRIDEQTLADMQDMDLEGFEVEEVSEDGEVTVKQTRKEKRFTDFAIAPANFRFSPKARHEDEADYLCHADPEKTRSDLVEMGFDKEQVYSLPGYSTMTSLEVESNRLDQTMDEESSKALEKVLLCEEYARIDMDGDGIAERVKVYRVDNQILIDAETGKPSIETVDDQPFSVFCPFPRPHRLVGHSLADKVLDIQLARSFVARQLFDGLALANMPRPIVDSRLADADTYSDILNPIPGSPIRAPGGAGTVQPFQTGFDIGKSMQAMEWLTGERESRTGITRLNQGLDADALNKMLCIETPVPMASGDYKRLGDITDGDLIVASDGFAVEVTKAHKIHDPERAYRLTFASGEQIDSGGEHLWTVQTGNDKRYGKNQTVNTDTLYEMMQGKGAVYVPRVSRPFVGVEKSLPLDPYMLGLWLGDGHSYAPRITTMDREILSYMQDWAPGEVKADKHQNSGAATTYYVGGLYAPLRKMGLLFRGDDRDADIRGKHIPEVYFTASYEQRLALLQGLMDTDGCHHSRALNVFCQKEGAVLTDTIRLIESLGGWPSVKLLGKEGRFVHTANHYQVTFSIADCPFRLTRKRIAWMAPVSNVTSQPIKAIERIAIKPMRCLTVNAEDGLFCVGKRFTVTHNTATGTALMQSQGQQQEEFIARNLAETLSRLFLKKYRLMRAEGDPFKVKVDGQYKEVDPSQWPEEVNMIVRVGLGSNSKDKRIQARMALAQLMAEGTQIGDVEPKHRFKMVDGLVRDMGIGTGDDYWTDPEAPPAIDPATGQPVQEEEKPDPAMMELQAKQAQQNAQLQLDRQKVEATLALQAQQNAAQIDAMREKHAMELEQKREAAALDADLAQQKADREYQLAVTRMEMEAQLEREGMFVRAQSDANLATNRPGGSLDA